jgi:hypothetical protein
MAAEMDQDFRRNDEQDIDIGVAMRWERRSISKLELILRERFSKLHAERLPVTVGRHLNIVKEWTKLLEESGCLFSSKGCLVEPVNHPKGFVVVSDPIKCRTIAVPEELALKAIVFGEIP